MEENIQMSLNFEQTINLVKDLLDYNQKKELGLLGEDADKFLLFAMYFASKGGDITALSAMRKISLKFEKTSKGNIVMRHEIGEKGWPSEEEYQEWASGVLAPKRQEVIDGLAFVRQEMEKKK